MVGIVDVFIDGLQVVKVKLEDAADDANGRCCEEDDSHDLLEPGSGDRALGVGPGDDGGDHQTDDQAAQVDIAAVQGVQRSVTPDAGDDHGQHVGDVDGFPGKHKDERTEGGPPGDDGCRLSEGTVGESRTAAGHGEHGGQFAVAQGHRGENYQNHQVTDGGGNGAAAVGHPVVQGEGPAHAHDGAETDGKEVKGT